MSWVSKSGAKSSYQMPRYDLVYWRFIRLLAERLGYGAEKHGDPFNYRLGVGDAEYYRDRVNHLREHAFKLDPAGTKEERSKQIAACAANLMMLLWLDDFAPVQESQPFIINEQPVLVNAQGDGDPGGAPV